MIRTRQDAAACGPTFVEFFVRGVPAPGGSKRAVRGPNGKALLIDACRRNKPWRDSVAAAGAEAMCGHPPMEGPLHVEWTFFMPRPGSHYRAGRNAGQLKESVPVYHSARPDTTKLIRAAEDALTGIVWRDDAAISKQGAVKLYALEPASWRAYGGPGVSVIVRKLET